MSDVPHDQPRRHGRLHSIDLARGVAVALMVATHASHAFLADAWKHNVVWYDINILFGFVAPTFVLLSGVTLWSAMQRRRDRGEHFGSLARRYLVVLLLGYWLQTPVLSLRQLIYNQRPEELARMFDANILQVIALSGLLIVGLATLFSSPVVVRAGAILTGIAATIAAPCFWTSDLYLSLPLPIRHYFAPQPIATFPLVPFLAYFAFGFALSPLLTSRNARPRTRFMALATGGLIMALAFVLSPFLSRIPPHDDFWGPGAQQVLFRLGGGVILTACCLIFAPCSGRSMAWLRTLGRRSLAVYVLHLMLIYGSPVSKGMRYWYSGALGDALDPFVTLLLAAAVLLACYHAISLWEKLRERSPRTALRLQWLWWGVFWGLFLLNP